MTPLVSAQRSFEPLNVALAITFVSIPTTSRFPPPFAPFSPPRAHSEMSLSRHPKLLSRPMAAHLAHLAGSLYESRPPLLLRPPQYCLNRTGLVLSPSREFPILHQIGE